MLKLVSSLLSLLDGAMSYFNRKKIEEAGEMRQKAKEARKVMNELSKVKSGADSTDSDYNKRVYNKYRRDK